jgi:hypothetical protein
MSDEQARLEQAEVDREVAVSKCALAESELLAAFDRDGRAGPAVDRRLVVSRAALSRELVSNATYAGDQAREACGRAERTCAEARRLRVEGKRLVHEIRTAAGVRFA